MLKGKKAKFFDAYTKDPLISGNGAAAAVAAGYGAKSAKQTAYRLLHKDEEMMRAIREYNAEQHERNTANKEEVEEFLTSVMRGANIENIPMFVGKGKQEFKEGKPELRVRLKAAELLGKNYGMFDGNAAPEASSGGIVVMPEVKDE